MCFSTTFSLSFRSYLILCGIFKSYMFKYLSQLKINFNRYEVQKSCLVDFR